MTDYVVCIPSYKRAELCNEKSLQMLKDNNIPAKKIFVYVANKEEYDEYQEIISEYIRKITNNETPVPTTAEQIVPPLVEAEPEEENQSEQQWEKEIEEIGI